MKMGMFIKKPVKRVFLKKREKHTTLEFINNLENIKVITKQMIPRTVRRVKSEAIFQNVFSYINLCKEGNRIPEHIVSNLTCYKKYYKMYSIPENTLHEIKEVSRMLNVYQFLYDNGGIYLNNPMKFHPALLLKNHEMVVINIDLFSCEKNSPIMKTILDEAKKIVNPDINKLFQSFYILSAPAFHFNSSIRFLI